MSLMEHEDVISAAHKDVEKEDVKRSQGNNVNIRCALDR